VRVALDREAFLFGLGGPGRFASTTTESAVAMVSSTTW
jgi:hypothetical protein